MWHPEIAEALMIGTSVQGSMKVRTPGSGPAMC